MRARSTLTVGLTILALQLTIAARAAETGKPAWEPGPAVKKLTSAGTKLKAGDKIAFFGDSITDQGGFVKLLGKALGEGEATKALGVKVLKHGLNGGRVPTVLEGASPWGKLGDTMEALLTKEQPTVVVIYLGINDVWHEAKGTPKEEFEAGLRKMIAMSRKVGATVMLCTPSVIGEEMNEKNKFEPKLNEYADVTRNLAKEGKTGLCDIHEVFLAELKKVNTEQKHKGNLTYDGVHMNEAGNALLAELMATGLTATLEARKE